MKDYFIGIYFFLVLTGSLFAGEYYVGTNSIQGNGTIQNPFNSFDAALTVAQPGDTVFVLPGIYSNAGPIKTVRGGFLGKRITIKALDSTDKPIIKVFGNVVNIAHPFITLENLIIDAEFASSFAVKIGSAGDYTIIRGCEIRNGQRDGVDINEANNVLIENSEIHHFLSGTYNNQKDAHGIVATGQKNLIIRNSNIYYVSGDCFQTDPSRDYPLWDNVLIENSRLWTGPLPEDAANFKAGEIPGENAVDTKINPDAINSGYRPKITIRNVEAYGFSKGFIPDRAAFNIKEQVECLLENIIVHHNEIAFRLRGPGSRGGAYVTVINAIAYQNLKVFRIEDGIEQLHIYNGTFDNNGINIYLSKVSGGYDPNGFDLRNSLFMGSKPSDAFHSSNLIADASFFVNSDSFDYHLLPNSPAINSGVDISEVTVDIDGEPRNPGSYDVGADEYYQTTSIYQSNPKLKKSLYLFPNFPNPFNLSTNISFYLTYPERIQLTIYSVSGRKVKTLFSGWQSPGVHQLRWDGQDEKGSQVSSGIYFYHLKGLQTEVVRMMNLIK